MEEKFNEEDRIKCPKCDSSQLQAGKHGFSAGKAIGGAILTGGIGVLAGLHGAKNVEIFCINCGHRWQPAKEYKKAKQETVVAAEDKDLQKGCTVILLAGLVIFILLWLFSN